MVEYFLDDRRYQLFLLVVRDEIEVVRICVEVPHHLIGRGLAEPLKLVAVLVGGVVPLMAHTRAVARLVAVSYRAGGEALNARYFRELYHGEQRAVSRGANLGIFCAGIFKAQRAEIEPRPEPVVVASADIALVLGHNALMLKCALEDKAVLADIVFFAECAKALRLLFECHQLCLENAYAARGGGDAEAAVRREDDPRRVHIGQPALVAVIGELAVMEDDEPAGGSEVSSALAVGSHIGYLALRKSGYLRAVEPIAVVVVNAHSLIRAYPDVACWVDVKAGYIVAEYPGHALHELGPVPALADERVKSVALRSDIDLVVAADGYAAALAGHADFEIVIFSAMRKAVEHRLCEYPSYTVAILSHGDRFGRELAGRDALLSV